MTRKKQQEIVYVKYKDHHWFDDDLTLDDIELYDEHGEQSILKCDIGILQKETKEYVIISSHQEERNIPEWTGVKWLDHRQTRYDNTSRILKCDIVQIVRWKIIPKNLF